MWKRPFSASLPFASSLNAPGSSPGLFSSSFFFRIGSVKAMIHHILVHLCCAFALYRRRFKRSLWPFSCASWRYGSGYVIPPPNWNEVTL